MTNNAWVSADHTGKVRSSKAESAETSADKPVSKMTRSELEAHAATVGIDGPYDRFANVDELRTAIEEAKA